MLQIQRIQKFQNFAAKVAIGNVKKYDHVTPCIRELKWLRIEEKYRYAYRYMSEWANP